MCITSVAPPMNWRTDSDAILLDHKGFTSRVKDWILAYSEQYEGIHEARQREMPIRNWKSKKMIQKLLTTK